VPESDSEISKSDLAVTANPHHPGNQRNPSRAVVRPICFEYVRSRINVELDPGSISWLSCFEGFLPLRIDAVEYNDPMMVVLGPSWSLSIVCPWRLTRDRLLICAFGGPEAEARLSEIIGVELTDVTVQACAGPSTDPAFRDLLGRQPRSLGDAPASAHVRRVGLDQSGTGQRLT